MRPPFSEPPGPAPQRADSQRIVAAALAAAVELGPDATLAQVADRAGIGLASLHRYFPTTAAIFAEISRQMYRTLLVQVREILGGEDRDLRSVVGKICRIAFDGPNVSPEYRRRLNLEIPLSWSKTTAEAVYQEVFGEVEAWLASNLAAPPADLSARVFLAFAAIRGAVLMTLLYPALAPSTEVMRAHLTDTVVALLTA